MPLENHGDLVESSINRTSPFHNQTLEKDNFLSLPKELLHLSISKIILPVPSENKKEF